MIPTLLMSAGCITFLSRTRTRTGSSPRGSDKDAIDLLPRPSRPRLAGGRIHPELLRVGRQQLLGRRHAAAEPLLQARDDRPCRADRQLLADNLEDERSE